MIEHFDWIFYTHFYNDINSANIKTPEQAKLHYDTHGIKENRKFFIDVVKYLKMKEIRGESLYCNINNNSFLGVNQAFVNYLLNGHMLFPNMNILEMDCGIACLSLPIIKWLNNNQGKYNGLVYNNTCFDWCVKNLSTHCQTAFTLCDNDDVLPYIDNTFDLVFTTSLFVTHSMEQLIKYLKEISRILKKNGKVIFTALISNNLINHIPRNKNPKIKISKSNEGFDIVNTYGEHGIIQSDVQIYNCLQQSSFQLCETVFGSWSDTSSDASYMDIICAYKT